jgi:hypothetical protein
VAECSQVCAAVREDLRDFVAGCFDGEGGEEVACVKGGRGPRFAWGHGGV